MANNNYKIPSIEKPLNSLIGFIFYYRLVFVLLAVILIIYTGTRVWEYSPQADKLKNCALVLTGGSIVIGIFYSIVNYEHNQSKFRHDVKTSRETLTFNTSCKMYDENMLKHFRDSRSFFENNKALFVGGNGIEIDKLFDANPESRVSLIMVLNYLEAISIGVEQRIMDEHFMKQFFTTIFRNNYNRFGPYIEYVKKQNGTNRVFNSFIELAKKWEKEN